MEPKKKDPFEESQYAGTGNGYTVPNTVKDPIKPIPLNTNTSAPAATNPYRKEVPEHLKGGEPNGGYNFEDTTDAALRKTATLLPSGSTSGTGGTASGSDLFGWLSGNNTGSGNPLADLFAPGGVMNPGSGNADATGGAGTAPDYAAQMKEAYDAQAAARADALEKMIAAYGAQNATIDQQYDQAVRDAYANARLSAIGNNEVLAAQGLAGGLYQNPYSGYSETSRIAQDNAMRANMFAAQMARNQAKAEVERDILELRAQGMYDQADLAAAQMEALINLQMQLDEQQYQREIDAWNMQQASQ